MAPLWGVPAIPRPLGVVVYHVLRLDRRKIKVCGDILESRPFKKMSRAVRQQTVAIQLVTFHYSTASVCGNVARHSLAFSGLFQPS